MSRMFLASETALNRCQLAFLAQLSPSLTFQEGRSASRLKLRWRDLVIGNSVSRHGSVNRVGVVSGQGLRRIFEAFIVTKVGVVIELGSHVERVLTGLVVRVIGVLIKLAG